MEKATRESGFPFEGGSVDRVLSYFQGKDEAIAFGMRLGFDESIFRDDQLGERFVEYALNDFIVDKKPLEEGLIEGAALILVSLEVELARVLE